MGLDAELDTPSHSISSTEFQESSSPQVSKTMEKNEFESERDSQELLNIIEFGEHDTPSYRAFTIDCLGNKYSPIHGINLLQYC